MPDITQEEDSMSGSSTKERTVVREATTGAPAGPSARAAALAERLERGARALGAFAAGLSDRDWVTPVPHDGRTVGVVVHHVASVYPIEVELAQRIGRGAPIEGVTMDDVHRMNARHAAEHADAARADAVALLEANSTAAARAIRALDDDSLDRAARASLYDEAPVTCQFVLEDHAVRHSYHHLALLARALGRAVPLTVVLAAVVCLLAAAPVAAQTAPTLVDTVRAATRDLRAPEAAIASGWAPATGCVSGPDLDPERPEALIFETRGGRTALVGVEFLVIAEQWHAAHGPQPPVLRGQHLHLVSGANRYGLPPFYELHVWAWKENPSGTFTDWHPHVTCDEVTGR